jgi:hypothetical protein
VSHPLDRYKQLDVPALDKKRGEVWLRNPWDAGATNHNLSAYEPNQVFLNLRNRRFVNIGYLTGADSDGDGRGVLVADVDGDFQPDLLVRQSGGGPLRVFANRFPPTNRLFVVLEGTSSNSLGIGATLVAEVGDRRIVRQLFPQNNFYTVQASQVRFGLGQANKVDRLTVSWPSGEVQQFDSVPVNACIRITEGQPEFTTLLSGEGK